MMTTPDLLSELIWLRDMLCEAHNQFDLVYVDMDGERVDVMATVERIDGIVATCDWGK